MSRLLPAVLLTAMTSFVGCGARSALDLFEDAGATPSRRDAGPGSRDGGPDPRDADRPRIDAGASEPPCELSVVAERPINVERPRGVFDRPAVVAMNGLWYLLTTFVLEDGLLIPYGSIFDDSLMPAAGLSSMLGRQLEPYAIDGGFGWLGYCFRTDAGTAVVADGSPPSAPGALGLRTELRVPGGHCEDIARSRDGWLAGFVEGTAPDAPLTVVAVDDRGASLGGIPAFTMTTRVERRMRIAGIREGGFAWTGTSTVDRRMEVGVQRSFGAPPERFVVSDMPQTTAPPAIARWPFADDTLAIVHHAGGVVLVVVDYAGRELLRTEPFGFSMNADVTPAIADVPDGLVVAMANYGDLPFGGSIEVVSIAADGTIGETIRRPTERPSLERGGIDIAARGRDLVVHWAETDTSTPGSPPQTVAMRLRCAHVD